jgi:hypothetical protein
MIPSCQRDCGQGDRPCTDPNCQELSTREAAEFWAVVCTPLVLVLLWWVFA